MGLSQSCCRQVRVAVLPTGGSPGAWAGALCCISFVVSVIRGTEPLDLDCP